MKIETIQDIVDNTNEENLDEFIKALKSFIESNHAFRKIAEVNAKGNWTAKLTIDEFNWNGKTK